MRAAGVELTKGAVVRCDNCGARNPEAATWCTQCYASFADDEPVVPAPEEGASPQAPSTEGAGAGAALSGADGPEGASSGGGAADASETTSTAPDEPRGVPVEVGDVRDVDGVVEWRCRTCASWVALELATCEVCGAARAGFGDAPRPEVAVAQLDRSKVLAGGAAFPGIGHLLAGRTGSGVTRLVLGVLWLIGGIWWLATTGVSGGAPGVILILGALVLWVASYLDVQSLLDGRDERFGVRGLLWLVVGVTALLMIAVAWLATGPTLS